MSLTIRAGLVLALAFALPLSTVACAGAPDTQSDDSSSDELSSKAGTFETFTGADGKVYFDLVAANGQNVLRSQGYTRASSAADGIQAVLNYGTNVASFDVKEASDGEYYFNLVAPNHEVIGTSELYTTKSSATRGASSVRAIVRLTGGGSSAAPREQRFETFTGLDGQTYFHLRAGNGEIVLGSEGYKSAESALLGIASVHANGGNKANYVEFPTADGGYAFHLLAQNGETIAHSETYASKSNADRAIATIAGMIARGVNDPE